MKRLLLVVVLGALVVSATGCDVSPPAATVNGVTISQSTLNDELSSEVADLRAQCATLLAAGATASPIGVGNEGDGATPNAVTPGFADNALETLVLEQLEEQALATRRVTVTRRMWPTPPATTRTSSRASSSRPQAQSTTPTGCALTPSSPVANQLPGSFLRRQAASLADEEVFEQAVGHVDVSRRALEAYYASNTAELTQVCLNVIVADTEADAQAVHDQIAAGASFATAATSADADKAGTPSGGELQCAYPAALQLGTATTAAVEALATGALAEPLTLVRQGSTGTTTTFYLVVQMRGRELAAVRHAAEFDPAGDPGDARLRGRDPLNKLVGEAHVTVDPRYGTWSAPHGVTVPTPPPAAFVLNGAGQRSSPAEHGVVHTRSHRQSRHRLIQGVGPSSWPPGPVPRWWWSGSGRPGPGLVPDATYRVLRERGARLRPHGAAPVVRGGGRARYPVASRSFDRLYDTAGTIDEVYAAIVEELVGAATAAAAGSADAGPEHRRRLRRPRVALRGREDGGAAAPRRAGGGRGRPRPVVRRSGLGPSGDRSRGRRGADGGRGRLRRGGGRGTGAVAGGPVPQPAGAVGHQVGGRRRRRGGRGADRRPAAPSGDGGRGGPGGGVGRARPESRTGPPDGRVGAPVGRAGGRRAGPAGRAGAHPAGAVPLGPGPDARVAGRAPARGDLRGARRHRGRGRRPSPRWRRRRRPSGRGARRPSLPGPFPRRAGGRGGVVHAGRRGPGGARQAGGPASARVRRRGGRHGRGGGRRVGGPEARREGPDERDRGDPRRPAGSGPGGQVAAEGRVGGSRAPRSGRAPPAAGRRRRGARAGDDPVALGEAVGELLFAAADVARRLGVDPESALRGGPGGSGPRSKRARRGNRESRVAVGGAGAWFGVRDGTVGHPPSAPWPRRWPVGGIRPDSGRGNPLRWRSAFRCG